MKLLRKSLLSILIVFILLIIKDFIKGSPLNIGGNLIFALYFYAVFVFVNWAWESKDYKKKKS